MADNSDISLIIDRFTQTIADLKKEIKDDMQNMKKDILDLQITGAKSEVKVSLFWKIVAAAAVGVAIGMLKGDIFK